MNQAFIYLFSIVASQQTLSRITNAGYIKQVKTVVGKHEQVHCLSLLKIQPLKEPGVKIFVEYL